jgi:hypothetical protein
MSYLPEEVIMKLLLRLLSKHPIEQRGKPQAGTAEKKNW